MGLFSKKVTYYGVDSSKALDDVPKNYLVSVMVSGILTGRQIVPTILDASLSGPRGSLEKYTTYAKDPKKYRHQLPDITYRYTYANLDKFIKYLETKHSGSVTILAFGYGLPDDDVWAKTWLAENMGYGFNTGSYRDTYYYKTTVTVTETTTTTNPDGTTTTTTTTKEETRNITRTTNYEYAGAYRNTYTNTLTINLTYTITEDGWGFVPEGTYVNDDNQYTQSITGVPLPPEETMYLAVYTTTDTGGTSYYWDDVQKVHIFKYLESSRTIPELLPDPTQVELRVPPLPIYREWFKSTDDDLEDPVRKEFYDQVIALTDLINIPSEEIYKGIKESPELGKIRDTFLYFGVPIHTKYEASREYIYHFFNVMADYAKDSYNTYQAVAADTRLGYSLAGTATGVFKIVEQSYNMNMFFNYIIKEIKNGSIGTVGFTTIDINEASTGTSLYETYGINPYTGQSTVSSLPDSLVIKHQISSTQYAEIKIKGLGISHAVSGQTGVFGRIFGGTAVGLADKEDFLIPVSPEIIRKLSLKDSETVIFDAMHVTVYWQYTVKVKTFLGQLLTAFVLGAITGFISAIAMGTAINVASILINAAIKAVVGMVLEKIDPTLAMIVGIAFQVGAFSGGSILDNISNMSFADVLLKAVGAIQKLMQLQMMDAFADLQKDWEDFHDLVEDMDQKLENMKDMLPEQNMDPLLFLNAKLQDRYYKDPNDFFSERKRTNLAPIMKSACTDYHSRQKDCWESVPKFLNL